MSPIKRELLINYPENWDELAYEIKEANDWTCQACGAECRKEPSDRSKPVLCVAHVDHDYSSPEIFVAPMCVDCHLRHDAPFGMAAHRSHERRRRLQAGQLEMFAARRLVSVLSDAEVRELEQAWPSLELVPDGVDLFAEYPIVGGPI